MTTSQPPRATDSAPHRPTLGLHRHASAGDANDLGEDDRRQIVEPIDDFVAASVDVVGDRAVLDRLDDPDAARAPSPQLDEIIAAEAPIQFDRLARIAARRFGFDRVRQSRIDEIVALVPDELMSDSEFGTFVWRDRRSTRRGPASDRLRAGRDRRLIEIAPEELANAMVAIIIEVGPIAAGELVGITANLFGISRVTAQARAHLDLVLDWATGTASFLRVGDGIELPPDGIEAA